MQSYFWLGAAVMCLGAVGFILWPLLRRRAGGRQGPDRTDHNVELYRSRLRELDDNLADAQITQAEYEQLRKELQLALLADTSNEAASADAVGPSTGRIPVVAAVSVVVLAVVAYSDFGLSLGSLDDLVLSNEMLEATPHDMTGMRATVTKLERRLQSQPDNDQGWFLLAQSWRSLSEHKNAANAFRHLVDKFPGDAALAAYYAESLFMVQGQRFSATVQAAVDRALALDPNNLQMLEMSAMDAFRQGDADKALGFFRRALSGASGERAELLQRAISRITSDSGLPEASGQQTDVAVAPTPVAGPRVLKVLVEVAAGVDAKPGDAVYVYARAFRGPPMPLAVQRLTVAGLPTLITLTADMAMMAGMSLNDVDRVQLVARISASGIANASPDDYEVLSDEIDMTAEHPVFKLIIENRRG